MAWLIFVDSSLQPGEAHGSATPACDLWVCEGWGGRRKALQGLGRLGITARGGEAGAAPSCPSSLSLLCLLSRQALGRWQAYRMTSMSHPPAGHHRERAGMWGAFSPSYRLGTENSSPPASAVLSWELTHPPNPCLPLHGHRCPRLPCTETQCSPPAVVLLSQQGKGKDVGKDRLILVHAQHFTGHPVFLLGVFSPWARTVGA